MPESMLAACLEVFIGSQDLYKGEVQEGGQDCTATLFEIFRLTPLPPAPNSQKISCLGLCFFTPFFDIVFIIKMLPKWLQNLVKLLLKVVPKSGQLFNIGKM